MRDAYLTSPPYHVQRQCRAYRGATDDSTTIDLSDKKLTTLPSEIMSSTTLTDLNISKNEFRTLPYDIFQISSLKTLNVSTSGVENIQNGQDGTSAQSLTSLIGSQSSNDVPIIIIPSFVNTHS